MVTHPFVEEVGPSLYQVDLHFNEMTQHSSGYIIKDEAPTIIETGTGKSIPYLLRALKELDIAFEKVSYVIVTHIHLDHAGGAGEILSSLPKARLIVHKGGARHLINPEKLLASAREVYGQRFEELFGVISSVPESRAIVFEENMTLSLGSRTLNLYNAPGHSYHHLIAYSPSDEGIFTGDAAGILCAPLSLPGFRYSILTTTPTQFDPEAMKHSLDQMISLNPRRLFLTHFGVTDDAIAQLRRSSSLVDTYMRIGEESLALHEEAPALAGRLSAFHGQEIVRLGLSSVDPALSLLYMDMSLNASGIFHYLKKRMATGSAQPRS
jgi:glyoxylase-like metal-dependent hydrolase (beta-lactamase superfamily II)